MVNFKSWLILNENIEDNFEKWFKILVQYSKKNIEKDILSRILRNHMPGRSNIFFVLAGKDPESLSEKEKEYLYVHRDVLPDLFEQPFVRIIKNVLKEKNLENYNWFAFSIGFLGAKPNFFNEDLELAIDVTKRRIDNRELLKSEIGEKGWMVVGLESLPHIEEYLLSQQRIGNRAIERMKKQGKTLGEDEKYIRLLVQENNLKIYFTPALGSDFLNRNPYSRNIDKNKEQLLKNRHMVLCKYGQGTKWCTANPSGTFHEYYSANNIYIVHKNDKPVYQFVDCKDTSGSHQFMNAEDVSVVELPGDVYDTLNKYFKEKIDCYKIDRSYSLEELLSLQKNEMEPAYDKLTISNATELVNESNKQQAIEILNNLLKYKNKNKWLDKQPKEYYDKKRFSLIRSFINKLGVEYFIEKIGNNITSYVFRVIIEEKLANNFYQVAAGEKELSSQDLYDLIKNMFEKNVYLTQALNKESDEHTGYAIYQIVKKAAEDSKEKTIDIINLFRRALNSLSAEQIQDIIKIVGFEVVKPILNNITKVDSKLISVILKELQNYSQEIVNIKNNKGRQVIARNKIPMSNTIKYKEIEFIEYLLTKDLSTSAIKLILSGNYLNAKSTKERLEKIEKIAQIIGADKITKIKKEDVLSMIEDIGSYYFSSDYERAIDKLKRKYKNIKKSKPMSTQNKDKDDEKEKLRNGLKEIIKKYHRKLNI